VIRTKSVCQNGGRTSYRGLVKITKGAKNAKVKVNCDALILDDISRTDTYPYNEVMEENSYIEHEASVSKISEIQLYYLTSRGIGKDDAEGLIVSGYAEPIIRELPMEYAMELNDLLKLKGSVG